MQFLQSLEAAAGQQEAQNGQRQRRGAQHIGNRVGNAAGTQPGEQAVRAHDQQDARQQQRHQHGGVFAVVYLLHAAPSGCRVGSKGLAALLGALEALLDDGADGLDEDDDNQHQALEGVLNIHAEGGDGHDDEVDGGIGQGAEQHAEHLTAAAGHVHARQHHRRDGVHLIALAGGGGGHVADFAGLDDAGHAYHQASDDEHRDFDPGGVDARQTGALFIGAHGVDALAVLGLVGQDDEENDHQHEHEGDVGDGEGAQRELARAELHAQELIVAVAAEHGELAGGGTADGRVDGAHHRQGDGAVDQHGAQGDHEGGHLSAAGQHTVDGAAESAADQGGQHHQQDGVGDVEHHDGDAGAQHQCRADGQIDLSGDDDQRHTQCHGAHDTGVLAAEDGRHVAPLEHVAVGLDGECIAHHDDQENKDKAVL